MSIELLMPRPASMKCPNCGMPVTVQVQSIVDGGRQPELKQKLMEGRLNSFSCPACQYSGMMSAPLLYHDGDNEFLGVFVPHQANIGEPNRQKLIGELTTTLMNSLPPEQRKGYLFQAKQFLTFPSLVDAILIADGVTPEQLEAQREQLRLLQRLLDAQGRDDVLKAIVEENDEKLDYEFFALLSAMAERAKEDGNQAQAQQMLALRDQLLDMTSWGKEAGSERKILESLGAISSNEQLVEKLLGAADDKELEMLVQLARPALDYVLMQQAMEKATEVLRGLLSSSDPRAAVREHRDDIDDVLLTVLSLNLKQAEEADATDAVARLQAIWEAVIELLQENMPPEVRFINRLMEESFPEGTQKLLWQSRDLVDEKLMETMRVLADDLEKQGQKAAAKRLRDIRGQAVLMV